MIIIPPKAVKTAEDPLNIRVSVNMPVNGAAISCMMITGSSEITLK